MSDLSTTPGAGLSHDAHKYWAFISYSQKDEAWGHWLHETLETYSVPRKLVGRKAAYGLVPPRVFPIFRDRDELAGASDLGEKLRIALHESRTLVVICSPHAAASRWVDEEIRLYKSLER